MSTATIGAAPRRVRLLHPKIVLVAVFVAVFVVVVVLVVEMVAPAEGYATTAVLLAFAGLECALLLLLWLRLRPW